jgi:pyrroloquinoline-quinone synthase
MSSTTDLRDYVLRHGAINNPYLDDFKEGKLTDAEFRRFAVQFFAFVKHFTRILATLLANTAADAPAGELAMILTSELGDGDPKRRHEYLHHKFLRSVGIDPANAGRLETVPAGAGASLRDGCRRMLDLLEGFWMGMHGGGRRAAHAG